MDYDWKVGYPSFVAVKLRIFVDVPPQTAYWRAAIFGVARYCREHPFTQFRLPTSEWELINQSETVDGVIAVVGENDPNHRSTRFGKPVLNISSVTFPVPFPTVTVDNIAAGRLAADHLLAQGYRSFAYHAETRVYFSCQRLAGFRQRLAEAGKRCEVFDTAPAAGHGNTPAELRSATRFWLDRLLKPAGLYTHNDVRATALLDICQECGLAVPEQVGILGTDDDVLTATSAVPQLSSIDLAADTIGFEAARILVGIIGGEAPPASPVYIPARGVVQRQSTQPAFLDDELMARAMAFIREHATDPIEVADVLNIVPMARRSLERRFQQLLGRSPGQEICRVQMDKAKWLLTHTDQTLNRVARSCGYAQVRNFATAFRRETGTSPTEHRRLFRVR